MFGILARYLYTYIVLQINALLHIIIVITWNLKMRF